MAVGAGIDLVIELPAVFAVRSAAHFAAGGIRLLNALGVIRAVCFGAEYPDLSTLNALAAAFDSRRTVELLKQNLASGRTYAAALGSALAKDAGVAPEIIAAPNMILAVEYLRAIKNFAPAFRPIPIPRRQAEYHADTVTGPIASATAIRRALYNVSADDDLVNSALPASASAVMAAMKTSGRGPVRWGDFDRIILAKLRTAAPEWLENIPEVNEGLHHKLKTAAMAATTCEELIAGIKSKRYSRTRLQRILVHCLLGSDKARIRAFDLSGPLYARVLAFNDQGRRLMRQMAACASIPLITKTTRFLSSKQRDYPELTPLQSMLAIDTVASDIFSLAMSDSRWRCGGADFSTSPRYCPYSPSAL